MSNRYMNDQACGIEPECEGEEPTLEQWRTRCRQLWREVQGEREARWKQEAAWRGRDSMFNKVVERAQAAGVDLSDLQS